MNFLPPSPSLLTVTDKTDPDVTKELGTALIEITEVPLCLHHHRSVVYKMEGSELKTLDLVLTDLTD